MVLDLASVRLVDGGRGGVWASIRDSPRRGGLPMESEGEEEDADELDTIQHNLHETQGLAVETMTEDDQMSAGAGSGFDQR